MSESILNLYKECPRRPYAIAINDSNYSCWLQTAEGLLGFQVSLFEFCGAKNCTGIGFL